ncbi:MULTISPECIES: phage protease [unclassified Chelatococcus]|uniref:phage protease n=1 Tax=unclassified Chelatococcus TaxID=2638111 RepID=UPI001BCD338C|nr:MULTISPECIES: phage protease [unclassified Chelatococcus]CAH1671701.1 hypothetical protein CHELA41_23574 [Hyphomicrobiales bacterium]MBS7738496.1 hypothetical protein [Chelatococcus sp. HY11]MBX3542900.1 hypothetical protein [Chelatococcus sp.]MCO5076973.1 phage protease [Chelatococcus sp.]CAH1676088.1 hypothetical protein CHELA20_51442 [Hyphomicrobiales bacterium]
MISHLALARNDQPQPTGLLVETRVVALQAEGGPPKRIHILPRGPEIVGRDGRSWRMSHPRAVVDAFAANGMPLPIDYEHASEKNADGEARPAVG